MGRDLGQDLRFAVRTLARAPGFTLTAVVVLALGIGAPTTVFTLVDRIFFWSPPAVAEPDRLVRLYRSRGPDQGSGSLSHPDFQHYREGVGRLEGLAAWSSGVPVAYSRDGRSSDQLQLGFTSHDYFDVLGVEPVLGRFFSPDEDRLPGAHPVVVLSHRLWERAFGRDPGVVGGTLRLNGVPYTVVGVAARGFTDLSPLGHGPEAWAPLAMFGEVTRNGSMAWWERQANLRENWLQVVGRLAPGVTFEAAEAELQALASSLTYEGKPAEEGILVARQVLYNPDTARSLTSLSRLLLLAVAAVLLVAAANVAVLMLARATTRAREIGIRHALGASRGRVARQFLVETVVLAGVGGAAGIGLARALSGAAGRLLPFPFADAFRPDTTVLLAAVGLTVVTALGVGLAPALTSARSDPAPALGDGRHDPGRGRVRNLLVVTQVALSMTLVAAAVLFVRSFHAARSENLGFVTANRLIVPLDLRARGMDAEAGRAFLTAAVDRVAALPGVGAVTTTRQIPFQGDWTTDFQADPELYPGAPREVFIGLNVVSPGYFEVMGIPVIRGRALDAGDVQGAPRVAVVNEHLAETLWPEADPLGRTLTLGGGTTFEVAGVVRNAQYYDLGEQPVAQLYGAVQQVYQPFVNLLVATEVEPFTLAPVAQAALRELEPDLVFGPISSLDAVFETVTARYRLSATLVGLFGVLTLVLAAAGLYGVMAFVVTRRTREIGVRMALGADRRRVAAGVLRSGLALAAAGIALGLVGALALRRFAASLVFGVQPTDPTALVAAAAILLAVAALASLLPARRATRVDPLEAIRAQ